MSSRAVLLGALLALTWVSAAGAWTPDAVVRQVLDRGEAFAEVKSGEAPGSLVIRGAVDIKAEPDRVWAVVVDCSQARRLLPFVKTCRVVEEGPNWDIREHVIDYGLFAPRVTSRFRSDYAEDHILSFHCVEGGDLKECAGEWRLEPVGDDGTLRLTYENRLVMPFKAPMGTVKRLLRRDVLKGLRGLRQMAAGRTAAPELITRP